MNWFHKHDFRILHKGATEIVFACVECGKTNKTEIKCDHEWELKERVFVSPSSARFKGEVPFSFKETFERMSAGTTSILHHCTKCSELKYTEMKGVPNLEAFQ